MSEASNKLDPKWRPSSAALGAEEFEDAIGGGAVVVHFWAPWNPYDRQLDAHLAALRPVYEKKFRFYSVNADDTAFEGVMERHHVAALPAAVCFVNGRSKGRFHGVETVEALRDFLEQMGQPVGR